MIAILLDLLLYGGLVLLALRCLVAPGPRAAAMMFIVFGLLLALAWVLLAAPDVALAEAAIGAGVTGALLLVAATELDERPEPAATRARGVTAVGGLLCVVFAVILVVAVLDVPRGDSEAMRAATASLGQAEIEHGVTAVLLAFRAYDTLLETAVLLAAAVAAQALGLRDQPTGDRRPDPVLTQVVKVSIPAAVLVALYLLWAGASATGGAFQAGAVLAGAWLLARFAGTGADPLGRPGQRGVLLSVGLVVFATSGLAGLFGAGIVLAWPSGWVTPWILVIELALMLSIAAALVALFGERATDA
jgi:multisubunit Na+/H+ antiporter MnhB subunit